MVTVYLASDESVYMQDSNNYYGLCEDFVTQSVTLENPIIASTNIADRTVDEDSPTLSIYIGDAFDHIDNLSINYSIKCKSDTSPSTDFLWPM